MEYRQIEPVPSQRSNFLASVFAWMVAGLGTTACAAYFVAVTPSFTRAIFGNPFITIALVAAQLVLVMILSFALNRLSYGTALILFLAYAVLTGILFSWLILAYTSGSIFITFAITAAMFGFMALYGYLTNADLSSMGALLRMALVGFIIALLVNLFLHSTLFDTILSVIGVIIFSGLTAYDMQQLKQLSAIARTDHVFEQKASLIGALALYLDFINLFLSLIRFTGKRRE